jgi:signal transduction histidine kinase
VIQTVYDIIKAHGGEIKVETKEARPDDPCLKHSVGQTLGQERGTEFIIQLPII